MTAQAKPQAWMQWCLAFGKTTLAGALKTMGVVIWLALALFLGIPATKMVIDHWAATPLWQGMKEGWVGKPPPASVPQAKAKGAK